MKQLICALLSAFLLPLVSAEQVVPEDRHSAQIQLINGLVAGNHYKKTRLDDAMSAEILETYLEQLDARKYIFTKADIENFGQFEFVLDDIVKTGDLDLVFDIYNTYAAKRKAHAEWALEQLKSPFPEDEAGTLELDVDEVDWATDQDEIIARWHKYLMNEWISLRLSKQSDQKARDILTKRYNNKLKHLDESRSNDIFQTFANAVSAVFDPHTSYFSPRSSEDFDINMSLSLEGVGATLTIEEEIITITQLIEGGPAKKSGQLARNDMILGVAQGEDGDMEDVVGWRLADAVRLIRGKRGTVVRLRIQKYMSDEIVDVRIVREKIKLEEQAAKSEIKHLERDGVDYRVGVITLPSFYADFDAVKKGKKDYRSTTRDVKKLIAELQKDGIDGLMIDLRGNGGGSLDEVVSLTGLFLDSGPVVQVKDSTGKIKVRKDTDGKTFYDGPLAVLIDKYSASASEIFAGAIKDYGRGIILGEPSYGKGSVQTIIGLSRFVPDLDAEKIGQFKMTIAMFYRINGSSTQIKGVLPDIYIPNKESYEPSGESEQDHALEWDAIELARYEKSDEVAQIIPQLQHLYDERNRDNPMMQNLLAMTKWKQAELDDTVVSLSLKERRKERKRIKDTSLTFQNTFRKLYGYPLLDTEYWNKREKEKTDEELKSEKDNKVDPVLSIAGDTVVDYIRLREK